jgi:hypothetical protein
MDEGNPHFVVEVGMCIGICLVTMGSPSCVSNSNEMVMFSLALVLQSLNAITSETIARCKLVQFEFTFVID